MMPLLHNQHRNEQWQRALDNRVKRICERCAGARAVRLIEVSRPDVCIIISRETNPKEQPWRATRFDDLGPSGHQNFSSMDEAIAAYQGKWGNGSYGLPYARCRQYRVQDIRK